MHRGRWRCEDVVGAKKCYSRGQLGAKKCSKCIVLSAKKCIFAM